MLWHRQAIFESKGDRLSSSAECRIRTWKSQDIYSPADQMPTHKPTELSRIKLKTRTQQPVPMTSEHSAHLTSLPFGFCTWLWWYTCLLLISMLWHGQAIFEFWATQRHVLLIRILTTKKVFSFINQPMIQWLYLWYPHISNKLHLPCWPPKVGLLTTWCLDHCAPIKSQVNIMVAVRCPADAKLVVAANIWILNEIGFW